jgi:hypothetical protein
MEPTRDNILIPTIQVRNGCIVYYKANEFRSEKKEVDFKKPTYGGDVTKGVQKRIGRAIDIFLQTTEPKRVFNSVTQKSMDFRLGFLTLTISDDCRWTADRCYGKLLKPFMRVMREKYNVKRYLWKYELQNRGTVHYHVTVDEFIPHDAVRSVWNKEQRKNRLLDTYAGVYGHFNANSTDVHKVWKIRNVGAYLGKYLSKRNAVVGMGHSGFQEVYFQRITKGKVWDCSTDLKRKRFSTVCNWENEARVGEMIAKGEVEVINLEKCTILKCSDPEKILTEEQKIDYCVWKYL